MYTITGDKTVDLGRDRISERDGDRCEYPPGLLEIVLYSRAPSVRNKQDQGQNRTPVGPHPGTPRSVTSTAPSQWPLTSPSVPDFDHAALRATRLWRGHSVSSPHTHVSSSTRGLHMKTQGARCAVDRFLPLLKKRYSREAAWGEQLGERVVYG